MDNQLPGKVGQHLFECKLCKERSAIFGVTWYGGYGGIERACVCHKCAINAVMEKLKETA